MLYTTPTCVGHPVCVQPGARYTYNGKCSTDNSCLQAPLLTVNEHGCQLETHSYTMEKREGEYNGGRTLQGIA